MQNLVEFDSVISEESEDIHTYIFCLFIENYGSIVCKIVS